MVNGYAFQGMMVTPPLHAGAGLLRFDFNATTRVWNVEAGWTGELYSATGPTASYMGTQIIRFVVNNVDIDLQSVTIVETQ
jgi:hypothetical protein